MLVFFLSTIQIVLSNNYFLPDIISEEFSVCVTFILVKNGKLLTKGKSKRNEA